MKELRYTLLSEGSSDTVLCHILDWLLHAVRPEIALRSQVADLSILRNPPKSSHDKILAALDLYPCDLLFIHRDADRASRDSRVREIRRALEKAGMQDSPYCCVIPVRMTEAWLLFDEAAIRYAAGNPAGTMHLDLSRDPESLPDPKQVLHHLIRRASGRSPRRLRRMNLGEAVHLTAQRITDFTPLRTYPAFMAMERELAAVLP
jgi:hypothetical protein